MDITPEAIVERQSEYFNDIYKKLQTLSFTQRTEAKNLEPEIYTYLKPNPQYITGLIIFMMQQIILGNQTRAKALAYKIWEIGGELQEEYEALYINNLIGLGLLEMAGTLLKSRFENIDSNINYFSSAMVKCSIASGNHFLLEKVINRALGKKCQHQLSSFIQANKHFNYVDDFQNIQHIIYRMSSEHLMEYDIKVYEDRGFSEIELHIYVDDNIENVDELYKNINLKIESYCNSRGIRRLNNVGFLIKNIQQHPALNFQDSKVL